MPSWRENVDPLIKEHLEAQIRETTKYQTTYMQSANPQNAQLWVAIANLSKQIFNINLKIKYMEKLIKDVLEKVEKQNVGTVLQEPVSTILEAKPDINTISKNRLLSKKKISKYKTKSKKKNQIKKEKIKSRTKKSTRQKKKK